ncbi:hypothetical protein B0H10DRAFT_1939415 [Mycena sp. CBHHK59/15]|nr:hypothetical protein B0H10DRAFT_1939415 [Mycena sp. CBHHK59/15]
MSHALICCDIASNYPYSRSKCRSKARQRFSFPTFLTTRATHKRNGRERDATVSLSLNNPFYEAARAQNAWTPPTSDTSDSSPVATPRRMPPVPGAPYHGQPWAMHPREYHPQVYGYQHPPAPPQQYLPPPYPPPYPHAAPVSYYEQPQPHGQRHLPQPQRPSFVPPCVPELPHPVASSYVNPYAPPQPYQTAPLDPRAGLPTSVSQNTQSMGPVPKLFALTTTNWKEAEKLSLEHDNWHPFSSKVENQLGMVPGAVSCTRCTTVRGWTPTPSSWLSSATSCLSPRRPSF